MLSGLMTYTFQNGRVFKYNIEAVDNSTTFSLNITSANYDALAYLASSDMVDDENVLWERRCDIGLANVKVETNTFVSDGKKVKAPVNADFFCRLGSLVRYAKMNCSTKNDDDSFAMLGLASGDFETVAESSYTIRFPISNEVFAKVSLSYGDITKLWLKTSDFEIMLEQDRFETKFFSKLKNAWSSGIAFNEEYLGFPFPKQGVEKDFSSANGMHTCIEDIVKAHPEKEFSWLLEKNYQIVRDDNLEEICNYIMNWDGFVYYDTETTGLNINFKSRTGQADQLVGVVLSVKYGESFFFPTQMKLIPNLCNGDHFYFMNKYMKPILEGKKLVAHNMTFDWKVGYIYDINCNIVHDTMALIKLTIGTERKNYPMSLKENAKLILRRDSLELSDLIIDNTWGQTDVKFWDLPEELVRLYACADTDNTNGLLQYALQNDLLGKYNATKVYEIEIAFSYAVAYQEFYGHRINIENLDKLRDELRVGQERCMKEMVSIVGHEFNPNSSPQLIKIMYGELGIPEQISRKTGRPTTDKTTLKKLSELTDAEDNIKYPFCAYLKEYREYEGVRKIVDKFPEHATSDGYIFSEVMQYGTTTGRVSIKSPNYQSYNDPVKQNVVPRPGYWMFDTDYSSVEYRVLGNMVGNKRIMENFKDPDFDYHAYQAAHMYNVPYSAVTKKLRKAAKGINFGLPYGMGDESLGVQVFGEATPENTRKAAGLRAAYFKGQEDIRDWFEYHRNKGVNEGFTETYFGRRRYYHREDFSVSSIRRQAGNQVIQGTAADIYKTAVGRVFKRICREGLLGKVILTGFIHDELLGEVSNDINPAVWLKILREEFEVKITNPDGTPWSPLYMGFGYGMSWYEAKSVELPIKLQWEIVEKYGDDGFPNWNGDGRQFCDTVPDMLRDFDVRDIRNQLLDKESQGKEIKPTLNNQVLGCVKEDAKVYSNAISDYIQGSGDFAMIQSENMEMSDYLSLVHKPLCEYLDETVHIQELYKGETGLYVDSFKAAGTTQEAITQFCTLHGVDRASVNLLDIAEAQEGSIEDSNAIYEPIEDEFEDNKQKIMDTRVDTLGLYLDIDEKRIILKMLPENYMQLIKNKANREGKGYQIRFKDTVSQKMFDCQAWIASPDVNYIQELYLTYFKSLK